MMDKPIPLWVVFFTIFVLVGISYLIYLMLENIKKDIDDNTKRSFKIKQ